MAQVLLDTCTFLWIQTADPQLSDDARSIVRDATNELFLSAASVWEIIIKYRLGRLPLPESPERFIPNSRQRHGIETLPIEEAAVTALTRLPELHRDPFDRIIICQAIIHEMLLLTPDEQVRRYGIRTVW